MVRATYLHENHVLASLHARNVQVPRLQASVKISNVFAFYDHDRLCQPKTYKSRYRKIASNKQTFQIFKILRFLQFYHSIAITLWISDFRILTALQLIICRNLGNSRRFRNSPSWPTTQNNNILDALILNLSTAKVPFNSSFIFNGVLVNGFIFRYWGRK